MPRERLEQITIYSPEGNVLPSYLHRNEKGNLFFNQSRVIEGGKDSEYQYVFDYGTTQERMKRLVPEKLRIIKNTRKDLTFLGFDDLSVIAHMNRITEIANDPNKNYGNSDDRREYRTELTSVYQKLVGKIKNRIDINKTLFFAPKNGGIFVRQVYEEAGVPSENFIDYKLSRVLVENATKKPGLMVGMVLGSKNPNIANYNQFALPMIVLLLK